MYTFPELLKKIRDESELTQIELAKILGVSTILVSMIESGQKKASRNFIIRLAAKLGVQPGFIAPFAFSEKKEPCEISNLEKNLIILGEKLQYYLIKEKAKKLKRHD